jgi:hypothetical protein
VVGIGDKRMKHKTVACGGVSTASYLGSNRGYMLKAYLVLRVLYPLLSNWINSG